MTLYSHLKTEFEVTVSQGQISPDGYTALDKLQRDFTILQFEQSLGAIFQTTKSFCKTFVVLSLLDIVEDEVLTSFHQLVKQVQDCVIKERKMLNNKMCCEKSKEGPIGPIVHNFTEANVPEDLMNLLSSGLNNVPQMNVDQESLVSGIEEDAINACKSAFVSIMGYYPVSSSNNNLNQEVISLLAQAPANSSLVNNLVTFREHYFEGLEILSGLV